MFSRNLRPRTDEEIISLIDINASLLVSRQDSVVDTAVFDKSDMTVIPIVANFTSGMTDPAPVDATHLQIGYKTKINFAGGCALKFMLFCDDNYNSWNDFKSITEVTTGVTKEGQIIIPCLNGRIGIGMYGDSAYWDNCDIYLKGWFV